MITIQVGQCGNQVGTSFFDTIAGELMNANDSKTESEEATMAKYTFFRDSKEKLVSRTVLVDTEPKVIAEAMNRNHKNWSYGKDMYVCEQTGSGNNWAYGNRVHAKRLRHSVKDKIRRLVEETDSFPSFHILQSVAGGTGSGVGTSMTEMIRDDYEDATIVNAAIFPYDSGEVIVQNYNAVLTLSELMQLSDGVILFENTRVHELCSKLLKIERPSFKDLNFAIASQLGSTLFPSKSSRGGLSGISEQCPHPGYRFLTIRSIPQVPERSKAFTVRTWSGLLKHMNQMLIADSVLEEGMDWTVNLKSRGLNKSISNRVTLRGMNAQDVDMKGVFERKELYAPWSYGSFRCLRSNRSFQNHERSVTMLSNSQSILSPLTRSLSKAWEMFHTGAYVHQYRDHGVEDGDFVAALIRMEQVLENYRSLSSSSS